MIAGGTRWGRPPPPFLVDDEFSLADVAVASYLLYIPQNFPGTDLSQWPHLVDYMRACASRRGYAAAFGPDLQAFVLDELDRFDDDDDVDRMMGPPLAGPRGIESRGAGAGRGGPIPPPRGSIGRTMMSPPGVGGEAGWDRRGGGPPPPLRRGPNGGVAPNDPLRDPRGAPPDPNGWTGPNGLGRFGPDGLRNDDGDDDTNRGGGRQLFSPSFRR